MAKMHLISLIFFFAMLMKGKKIKVWLLLSQKILFDIYD